MKQSPDMSIIVTEFVLLLRGLSKSANLHGFCFRGSLVTHLEQYFLPKTIYHASDLSMIDCGFNSASHVAIYWMNTNHFSELNMICQNLFLCQYLRYLFNIHQSFPPLSFTPPEFCTATKTIHVIDWKFVLVI